MKNFCVLLVWTGFGCLACSGQTNRWAGGRPSFAMHLQLRMLERAPKEAKPAGAPSRCGGLEAGTGPEEAYKSAQQSYTPLNSIYELVPLDDRRRDFELEVFQRLDRTGFFERPERESDSAVIRWAEGTFRPEVLRVGKTKVTCSLVTAIKRRNPLCLLNPLFLDVSW